MSKPTKTIPIEAYRFASDAMVSETDGVKRFSGVAYAGGILKHRFWGQVAFDLTTVTATDKLPMLIGHDRDKNAGFSESITINKTIAVSGKLLDNPDGNRIASDAAQGFPWQLSVHISPDTIKDVEKGYTINGHTFSCAGVVFQNAVLREISFTPTGVDADTSATIFSEHYFSDQQQQEVHIVTEEEAAKLQKENETLKEKFAALEVTAKEARDVARKEKTTALFAECDVDDEKGMRAQALKGFSDDHFTALADLLRDQHRKASERQLPAHLFSEQVIEGQEGGEDPMFLGMKAAMTEELGG